MNYIIYRVYDGDTNELKTYIYLISKNNFSNLNAKDYYPKCVFDYVYPDDLIIIFRKDLLKCLLTINPKLKDKNICKYLKIELKDFYDSPLFDMEKLEY